MQCLVARCRHVATSMRDDTRHTTPGAAPERKPCARERLPQELARPAQGTPVFPFVNNRARPDDETEFYFKRGTAVSRDKAL